MSTLELKLRVKVRWWVRFYIATLAGLCALMNADPDEQKVAQFISKYGIKIEVE